MPGFAGSLLLYFLWMCLKFRSFTELWFGAVVFQTWVNKVVTFTWNIIIIEVISIAEHGPDPGVKNEIRNLLGLKSVELRDVWECGKCPWGSKLQEPFLR